MFSRKMSDQRSHSLRSWPTTTSYEIPSFDLSESEVDDLNAEIDDALGFWYNDQSVPVETQLESLPEIEDETVHDQPNYDEDDYDEYGWDDEDEYDDTYEYDPDAPFEFWDDEYALENSDGSLVETHEVLAIEGNPVEVLVREDPATGNHEEVLVHEEEKSDHASVGMSSLQSGSVNMKAFLTPDTRYQNEALKRSEPRENRGTKFTEEWWCSHVEKNIENILRNLRKRKS